MRLCVRATLIWLGGASVCGRVFLCKNMNRVFPDNLVRLVCARARARGSGTGKVNEVLRAGEAGRIVQLGTFGPLFSPPSPHGLCCILDEHRE